jgi:hypothetical protein
MSVVVLNVFEDLMHYNIGKESGKVRFRLPGARDAHHVDHSITNIHAVVTGPILAIIQNYPRMRVLD